MQERDIFIAILEKSAAERPSYLADACGENRQLRERVEELLAEHEKEQSFFLDVPLPGAGATIDQPAKEKPGTQIGPYKLLQQIGEGGFGIVFMAEQHAPVKRKVALKVIKPGMDTRQVIARFEAERQALALMDHPSIAKVFDAGATDSGRPYFVMELVRGVPITTYCDENNLPVRARLELFASVCQAIQHAHTKGIIHRDIKPNNVLITRQDGQPIVKVIDFGVAKAMGQQLTDKTLFTEFAQMIGTPLYMSPEQAELTSVDIDTRSDIYSLGVLLYELLTGSTPVRKEQMKQAAFDELRRIIREEEPQKPSTRISDSGTLASIAAQRHIEPARLSRLVRGELDWIVMKALEKDRNRRYETASGFAADVQRYLDDEPVQACPPSAVYRLRKFMRRYKRPVLAAAVLLLTLVGGIIGTTLGMIRATGAEARAISEAKQKGEALKGKDVALVAAGKSKRHADEKLFESYVSQARAFRMSRRSGQRFESLEVLNRATRLARTLDLSADKFDELRNSAIASLALPDLHLTGPWNSRPMDAATFDVDEAHALLAITDLKGDCSIRRVNDDAELHSLPGLGGWAIPHFSRDGRFVAVMHYTNEGPGATGVAVQLWSLEQPTARRILSEAAEHEARYVDFHRSGREVALAYNDGRIGLFELPSGRVKDPPLAAHTLTREVVIALHPTQPLVAVCSYFARVVQIRDVRTGEIIGSLPQSGRPNSVAWHPDGQTLAVGHAYPPLVVLYDRNTLQPFRTMEAHAAQLTFNHAGDRLAAHGWDGSFALLDVGTGKKLFGDLFGVARRFSRDDRRLSGGLLDGKYGFFQVGDGREHRTLARNAPPGKVIYQSVAVHPEGRLLACGMRDGFGLWDLTTGSELKFISLDQESGGVMYVLFEPSGSLLTAGFAGLLRWPVSADPKSPGRLQVGPPQRLLPRANHIGQSQDPDGRVIVTSIRAVESWEAYAGGWILHADKPNEPIRLDAGADIGSIAVSPDGGWVVTVSHAYGLTKISDARDGRLVKQLTGNGSGYPRFSPDGRWLCTGIDGGRLLAVGTWEPGPRLDYYGAFAPDSRLMAFYTTGGARLVDRVTGLELARLEDPDFLGVYPHFTPDGAKLLGVSESKGIRVWDLRLIRQQLEPMGLDWEYPEFPAADSESKPPQSLNVELLLGDFVAPVLTSEQKSQQEIARQRVALETNPDDAKACNYLAWQYVAGPDSHRDPKAAVPLAEKAVQLEPENPVYCNTLGVAYYRSGRYREAVDVLRDNLDRDEEWSRAFDLYFLAMSHHHLGEAAQSQDYYAWAVRWPRKLPALSPSHLEELEAFRIEAKELLKPDSITKSP